MDLLSELETLKADYSAAQTLLEEAKVNLSALQATITEKETALQDASAAIEALNASVASKDSSIADLKAKVADLEAKDKTATEKAVEIVASQGIAPLTVDNTGKGESKTKEEVIAEYKSLKGKAKSLFYEKNKALIYGN
jgi:septal ring factor EnvC (AmiA/AmiB activator)